jgi:hypothetical protein
MWLSVVWIVKWIVFRLEECYFKALSQTKKTNLYFLRANLSYLHVQAIVTSVFLADDFSAIASVNNDITSVSGFTTIFFASAASSITMQGAFVDMAAGLDTVAFVDDTSGFAAIGNFVSSVSGITL